MLETEISQLYEIVFASGMYGISGEEKIVFNIVGILNKNNVSVFHAKDVVFDLITGFLYK